METKIYKPNKKRIIRDALIIAVLMLVAIFAGSPLMFDRMLVVILSVGVMVLFYFVVVGVLPSLRIENEEIIYRSDYGISHSVPINKIHSITKGSGVGGYRHALFVKYSSDSGREKVLKIKSSIFKQDGMRDFIKSIKNKRNIKTNEELEDFLK